MLVALVLFVGCTESKVEADAGRVEDGGSGDGGDTDAGSRADEEALIDQAPSIDRIELVETASRSGWTVEHFRNRAYTCGHAGYQTFTIAYPTDLAKDEKRPLWTRMHGGGTGAFLADGSYEPPEFHPGSLDEEGRNLAALLTETGLVAKVRARPERFRFLMPSMCDHDMYSGVGLPEPHDPHQPDENGEPRAADGLLATRAAVAYALAEVSTSHLFVHGTSAGSAGAFSLSYSLERAGLRVNGVVNDSGVIDDAVADVEAQVGDTGTCQNAEPAEFFQLLAAKVGPLVGDPWFSPAALVARGEATFPIMHVWDHGDYGCCGDALVTYTDEEGAERSMAACDRVHGALATAIDEVNPGGASENLRTCVTWDMPDPSLNRPCNRHSPTKYDAAENDPYGDTDDGGADYNELIVEWVADRLREPPAVH
ncbi:MAG: hypothetical protein HYY06_30680 [Deltaproteobacteria bacterium]|nr:hypothetical protein [Deltaproteobacteria bacterium]